MRVRKHRELFSEVHPCDEHRFRVVIVTMLAREVDPRIVVFLDVLLESKPPFNILSICGALGDQRSALSSV